MTEGPAGPYQLRPGFLSPINPSIDPWAYYERTLTFQVYIFFSSLWLRFVYRFVSVYHSHLGAREGSSKYWCQHSLLPLLVSFSSSFSPLSASPFPPFCFFSLPFCFLFSPLCFFFPPFCFLFFPISASIFPPLFQLFLPSAGAPFLPQSLATAVHKLSCQPLSPMRVDHWDCPHAITLSASHIPSQMRMHASVF